MFSFLSLHSGTIIIGLLVLAAVVGIIVHLVRKKRSGKCVGCDCACGGCPHSSGRHAE